jgi:glycosyltransferase involved in cell wall biosynthesis
MRVPYDAFFKRFIFGSYDGVIFLTEFEKATLSPFVRFCEHSVIPNGVDLDEIRSVVVHGSITDLLCADERVHLRAVYCGNLLKYKGVQYLLRALSTLKNVGISVHLSVVGDGPYREHLAKLTQYLGIQTQVRFLGFLPRPQQLSIIKASDVLVLPSEFEAFGIVLVEAMALGKAVIATASGGPTSLGIPKEFLVQYGDSQGLASAMKLLVSSGVNRQQLGAGYVQIVKEKYSWEQIGNSTADFYASL